KLAPACWRNLADRRRVPFDQPGECETEGLASPLGALPCQPRRIGTVYETSRPHCACAVDGISETQHLSPDAFDLSRNRAGSDSAVDLAQGSRPTARGSRPAAA